MFTADDAKIAAIDVLDVRFPMSRLLDGSDAMNPDPDCSAAYVIVRTDAIDGLEGHGSTFTFGRGIDGDAGAIRGLLDRGADEPGQHPGRLPDRRGRLLSRSALAAEAEWAIEKE